MLFNPVTRGAHRSLSRIEAYGCIIVVMISAGVWKYQADAPARAEEARLAAFGKSPEWVEATRPDLRLISSEFFSGSGTLLVENHSGSCRTMRELISEAAKIRGYKAGHRFLVGTPPDDVLERVLERGGLDFGRCRVLVWTGRASTGDPDQSLVEIADCDFFPMTRCISHTELLGW